MCIFLFHQSALNTSNHIEMSQVEMLMCRALDVVLVSNLVSVYNPTKSAADR